MKLLTWVMFLKFLDDREKLEEAGRSWKKLEEARIEIGGKKLT